MRVLFHINENCKWKEVLGNALNMIKACKDAEENCTIEILANGEAVISLREKTTFNIKMIAEFIEVSKEGVIFAACKNSLNKYVINEEDLLPFVDVVPAGVVEIVKKQEEGYCYIKP